MAARFSTSLLKLQLKNYISFLMAVWQKMINFAPVLVRESAINRESGENPGQTRYCNSFKTH